MNIMNKKTSLPSALRLLALIFAFPLLVSSLFGCRTIDAVGDYTVNTETVMEVGGYDITFDEYRCFYLQAKDELAAGESGFWNKEDAPFDELKQMVERSIARKYAILTLVDEYDIELTEQDETEINDVVNYYIEYYGGMTGFRQWLATEGLTGRLFREQYILTYYYDEYLRDILLTGIDDLIKIDDKTVSEDIYENFYHYTWIFVSFDEGENYLDNAQKIADAYAELEDGKDFYEVARKYSEWTGNEKIGIYATKGEKVYTIENTALSLAEGEYSKVLAMAEGHAILMRLPFDTNYINENFDDFVYQSATRRYNELLDNMALEMEIEYTDYYDTLTMEILTDSKAYFMGTE